MLTTLSMNEPLSFTLVCVGEALTTLLKGETFVFDIVSSTLVGPLFGATSMLTLHDTWGILNTGMVAKDNRMYCLTG
jgi:hypothetical protein